MIQKIRRFSLSVAAALAILMPGLVPTLAMSTVSANTITSSVCTGTNNATGDTSAAPTAGSNTATSTCGTAGSAGTTDLSTVASKIVSIFSIIIGITAVLMIIYGGFRYITSGGDSGKVGNAKNTLIYAIIGLIVVALA